MHTDLLGILRCPYCGTELTIVENQALVVDGPHLLEGVLGCQCCAYPVVAGIPVLIASDDTRRALHTLEAGQSDEALLQLLGVSDPGARREDFLRLMRRPDATYREALELLCEDAEGVCFLYRFTDPTYLTMEALLGAIAQAEWPFQRRTLDLCGGSGHLTRILSALRPAENEPASATVLADVYFWKLWLASRFTEPASAPVCCDANHPLPFARDAFSTVLLADAFPYIWHKRLLAEEMMRLTGEDGVVVMPHLHSALGDNFSAGNTLTPAAYRELFGQVQPRLFSDARMFDDVLEHRVVDLTRDMSPEELGDEAAVTLVASTRADLFRRYEVPDTTEVTDVLTVNPLYRVQLEGDASVLSLAFPTPEYEEEFGDCRRYLPDRVTINADLTGPITRPMFGADYPELRKRRVLIDAPVGYC
ncbi:MAG: hypothetical protein O2958_07410 [Gemmatimonadetes bacterium]|nr:hypothetical protein [Gemmatimonadota bacterium]MDA1103974.1 hypothetical protein [Gemmatimonadota bacterium]